MKLRNCFVALAVIMAVVAMSSFASAQLNSLAQPIQLKADLNESLTVTLSANLVNFTLAAGAANNPGSTGITATTAWVLLPGRTHVTVNAYFTDATAALSDGAGNNIPSSAFEISKNGGARTAVINAVPYSANGGLQLENVPIDSTNRNGSVADLMTFNINLSSLAQLPANAYTGQLNIQAQATP